MCNDEIEHYIFRTCGHDIYLVIRLRVNFRISEDILNIQHSWVYIYHIRKLQTELIFQFFFLKGEKKEERSMKKGKIKNIGYRFDWFSIDFENSVIDPWTKWQGTDCFRGLILCMILIFYFTRFGGETRWTDVETKGWNTMKRWINTGGISYV